MYYLIYKKKLKNHIFVLSNYNLEIDCFKYNNNSQQNLKYNIDNQQMENLMKFLGTSN